MLIYKLITFAIWQKLACRIEMELFLHIEIKTLTQIEFFNLKVANLL